jgi:hypothetical protein
MEFIILRFFLKILAFSEVHISTGSTLASLSNQNILEERFIDDFDENSEMPSIPESSDEADNSI